MKHFLDIGANRGQTFDWLATQPDDYRDCLFWAIEPSPRHWPQLIARCEEERNKNGRQIRLCPFGLTGRTGVDKFYEKDDPQGDSFEAWTASDHETTNSARKYEIYGAMISISNFIAAHTSPGDEIILDIDAEGAEYDILRALFYDRSARDRIKRIMVEFHQIKNLNCVHTKKQLCEEFASFGLPLEVRGFVP